MLTDNSLEYAVLNNLELDPRIPDSGEIAALAVYGVCGVSNEIKVNVVCNN